MRRILTFFKSEFVLIISAVAAIVSIIFVPVSASYISYIDFRVLVLLFCLMLVVAGFTENNVFSMFSQYLTSKAKSVRLLSLILVMITFFSSMFVTNDVALITFVPFTILTLCAAPEYIIYVIALQTIAANLGSMLTPIGNPHNLYIYSYYNLSAKEFFKYTIPFVLLSFVIITLLSVCIKDKRFKVKYHEQLEIKNKKETIIYFILFLLCLASVFNLVHYLIVLGVVLVTFLILNKKLIRKVDYGLLFTFVCFFIFVGNIQQIPSISNWISGLISGKELLSTILISQVISNVPAAVMLSKFTDNYKALIIGTNIGSLGTFVASLASLISLKIYMRSENAKPLKYLGIFTILNVSVLFVLLIFNSIIN